MNLNNSTRNSCFSAIFDPSDPYENYLDKKACIKKQFRCSLKHLRQCMNCRNDDGAWNYCLNKKYHSDLD